jgi:hypothetical protein
MVNIPSVSDGNVLILFVIEKSRLLKQGGFFYFETAQ